MELFKEVVTDKAYRLLQGISDWLFLDLGQGRSEYNLQRLEKEDARSLFIGSIHRSRMVQFRRSAVYSETVVELI
ncbi:MAG: hypothetical protein ACE5DX_04910 [Candidatus Dojkabacteria bacterium]